MAANEVKAVQKPLGDFVTLSIKHRISGHQMTHVAYQ